MNPILLAIGTFATGFATDWCWTKYIKRASQGAALPAAWWSVSIYALSSINIMVYTKSPLMLIPMLFGYFLGTLYAVKHDNKTKHKTKSETESRT